MNLHISIDICICRSERILLFETTAFKGVHSFAQICILKWIRRANKTSEICRPNVRVCSFEPFSPVKLQRHDSFFSFNPMPSARLSPPSSVLGRMILKKTNAHLHRPAYRQRKWFQWNWTHQLSFEWNEWHKLDSTEIQFYNLRIK